MTWDYTKDVRTDDQVKKDYEFGKANEEILLNAIRCQYRPVNNTDKFGSAAKYYPDFVILTKSGWKLAEVKFSRVNLKYVELKENQLEELILLGGMYIQGTPKKYAILDPQEIKSRGLYVEKGYCNKPCYRLMSPEWREYNLKPNFVK